MKHNILFKLFAALMICAIFISCSKIENSEKNSYDIIDISLKLGGEYGSLIENDNDFEILGKYLGIGVYYKNMNVAKTDDDYSRYAFGLFSDSNQINIHLKKGYCYRFECLIVEDGKDKVFTSELGNGAISTGKYPYDYHIVNNEFIYSDQDGFYFQNPYVSLRKRDTSCRESKEIYAENADVVMFYGAFDNFVPEKTAIVDIPMYRIGYGLKVKADGIADGFIEVNASVPDICYDSDNSSKSESIMTVNYDETCSKVFADGLFTVSDYPDWKQRILNYKRESDISLILIRGDGSVEKYEKTIDFKRNKMTVLSVNPISEAQIIFNLEDTDLTEEQENIIFSPKEWEDSSMDINL